MNESLWKKNKALNEALEKKNSTRQWQSEREKGKGIHARESKQLNSIQFQKDLFFSLVVAVFIKCTCVCVCSFFLFNHFWRCQENVERFLLLLLFNIESSIKIWDSMGVCVCILIRGFHASFSDFYFHFKFPFKKTKKKGIKIRCLLSKE